MKRTTSAWILVTALASATLWLSCGQAPPEAPPGPATPVGQALEIQAPLGLPPVPIPADNPATADTVALGRRLYYDKNLSSDGTIACASCHRPEAGFGDPDPFSAGVGGQRGGRQAPVVLNAAYFDVQFWDGRSPSLEDQAAGPVQNPIEMANTLEAVEEYLSKDPSYVEQFEKAWGPGPITYEKAGKSIASFERTVIAGNSPFDRWFYGKEEDAMDEPAKRGYEVFRDPAKGNCEVCHSMQEGHALFTDNKFHNLGVGVDDDGGLPDTGRYDVTQTEEDKGAFKTPTLRNVALSAPYMHDGSLATLKDVVDFYIGAGNSNDWRDKDLKELDHLTRQDRDDLEAFMNALTGEIPPNTDAPGD
jgi:cytochrome c peroxidase